MFVCWTDVNRRYLRGRHASAERPDLTAQRSSVWRNNGQPEYSAAGEYDPAYAKEHHWQCGSLAAVGAGLYRHHQAQQCGPVDR